MCNPRRVQVRLAEEVRVAWQREVSRAVTLEGEARAEARIQHGLGSSVSPGVLAALAANLNAPGSQWQRVPGGWRIELEGGHAFLGKEDSVLEIVATRSSTVTVTGEARDVVTGDTAGTASSEQEAGYWDDGFGGRDEAFAKREAEAAARRELAAQRDAMVSADQEAAEIARADALEQAARLAGEVKLAELQARRREEHEREAQAGLERVGQRAMAALGPYLARAYRDEMQAYAAENGASNFNCQETDGVIDISFQLDR